MAGRKRKSRTMTASLRQPNKKTPVEELLHTQLKALGITGYQRNVKFIPKRRFEADFYFPELRMVVEVDGGIWLPKSGHTSGEGYQRDRRRDQLALAHGLQTLRFTSEQIRSGEAIDYLMRYLPVRQQEVERLSENPCISMDFATQLPKNYGT